MLTQAILTISIASIAIFACALNGVAHATEYPGTYCYVNGNACADEGQAYRESYYRAVQNKAYNDQLAMGYGHATRYKVCGPYRRSMGGYPYNNEPAIGWVVRATTEECITYLEWWNYYGTADSCQARPSIPANALLPNGKLQCTGGCEYSSTASPSSGVTFSPTGNVCDDFTFDPDKNNQCDAVAPRAPVAPSGDHKAIKC